MSTTPGQKFYEDQLRYLSNMDVEGLMNQYHENASVVGFDFQAHGIEQIRPHFVNYLARLGKIALKSTDKWAETGDSIFFEATVETQHGEARVYDVFILRDGKATHHFTGLISFTPNS